MDELEKYTRFLGQELQVKIDRPKGTKHPKFNFIYEINYGYIPHTLAGDELEIDAYVIGVNEAINNFKGKCIAVVVRKDDVEHKLVVSKDEISERDIYKQIQFVEDYFDTEIILAGSI